MHIEIKPWNGRQHLHEIRINQVTLVILADNELHSLEDALADYLKNLENDEDK